MTHPVVAWGRRMEPTEPTAGDLAHLRRCVDLAREALEAGDEPFGSLLVGPDDTVLREERNRTGGGDQTRHPELDLARWAAAHVAADVRARCTVYTSGEHCPMCAAGHAWVGLGRIVLRRLLRAARAVAARPAGRARACAAHRRGRTGTPPVGSGTRARRGAARAARPRSRAVRLSR